MSFFICHNLWNLHCLETVKRLFRHLLSWMCWSANEDGPRQLDSFLTLSVVVQKSRCVRSEWLRRVCRCGCVCRRVLVTDRMGYIANLINPVLQVRNRRIPCVFLLFCFVFISNSLPVIVWCNLSLSSCIEPLFHLKEPLPIYYLQMFHGCTVAQSHC